jgi:hypothetical protein
MLCGHMLGGLLYAGEGGESCAKRHYYWAIAKEYGLRTCAVTMMLM